jgi:hypothetical protein
VSSQRVFIRADLNVPLDAAGHITEDTRIRASIPCIEMALKAGAAVDPVADQHHLAAHQLAEPLCNRRERVGVAELTFDGTPEVRRDHHGSASGQRVADAGHGRTDAAVVADAPVVERHVEVGADEHALLAHVDVGKPQEIHARYFAAISAIATSSIRFENPHSLSYQLHAFTSRPDTYVSVESNVDDAGSWLKSIETSGASL